MDKETARLARAISAMFGVPELTYLRTDNPVPLRYGTPKPDFAPDPEKGGFGTTEEDL